MTEIREPRVLNDLGCCCHCDPCHAGMACWVQERSSGVETLLMSGPVYSPFKYCEGAEENRLRL